MHRSSDSSSSSREQAVDYSEKPIVLQTVISDPDLQTEAYGPSGFAGLFASSHVALCVAFSAIGGLLFGYDQGIISVIITMDNFLDKFPEVSELAPGSGFYKGLMTAIITLGAVFGAFNVGWISDAYSRKYTIMFSVAVFTIGSVLQTAAVDYAMLVVARLISGVGIGLLSAVVPLYISEVSPAEIRGTLLVFQELSIVFGIIMAYWVTFGTRYIPNQWSWRLPFLLQVFPSLVLGAGTIFLPFSPRWLANQGMDNQCLKTLSRLRQLPATDSRVEKEWLDILAEARFQQQLLIERHSSIMHPTFIHKVRLEIATWADCFKKSCWRRTVVASGLAFFQQFVGINALIYYSPALFAKMGLDYNMELVMSGVLNVMQLVGIITSIWSMDRIGRRTLLLGGSIAMLTCHLVVAGLVGRFSGDWSAHRAESWVSVAFLLAFTFIYGCSWGPVGWAMPAEIFPSSLRAKGVATTVCFNWISNFVVGLITPSLVQTTNYGTYIFFAAFCGLAYIFTFYCVPETKGRSLEEMDQVFGDRTASGDMERKCRVLEEVRGVKKSAVDGGVCGIMEA
ncbi:Sugar transport protein 7 [Cytospora mali]|uniref:Sugar transport protein 7 n=1 Tax=Cytospora mali TaxID=578113 RepID=A0A194WD22_CYTMA|nr:Sugar transport protein 7 [Valsa mali]